MGFPAERGSFETPNGGGGTARDNSQSAAVAVERGASTHDDIERQGRADPEEVCTLCVEIARVPRDDPHALRATRGKRQQRIARSNAEQLNDDGHDVLQRQDREHPRRDALRSLVVQDDTDLPETRRTVRVPRGQRRPVVLSGI
jgi:hypothetical protein